MMRTIRPLPPVCRALLAVEHDWPALRKVIGEYTEFEAEPPMPGLGLPEHQRSELWAYMRECEAVDPLRYAVATSAKTFGEMARKLYEFDLATSARVARNEREAAAAYLRGAK